MKEITDKLTTWYLQVARPLPWRLTSDPYAIWISEVMLQQTQVATVIPYWKNFLTRFPTVSALANSTEESVLEKWSGLGYYSRAKNLKRGAEYLQQHFNGDFPRVSSELLKVPGIGPYTAGAILSIAYNLAEPIVDGNVARVFSRLFCVKDPIETVSVQKLFWKTSTALVSVANQPKYFNQALMELGATLCSKGTPKCELCPLSEECRAKAQNLQNHLPNRKPRREKVFLTRAALVVESQGKIYLRKNTQGTWWADLWDFPHLEGAKIEILGAEVREKALAWGANLAPTDLGSSTHMVTHHKLSVTAYKINLEVQSEILEGGRWFTREELQTTAISSLARKVLAKIPLGNSNSSTTIST